LARALLFRELVMSSRRHVTDPVCIEFDPLRRRCIRLAKTGQYRKAAIALAELAHREQDAATWVRLGAMLLRAGRREAAVDALKQGLWLHRIRRDQRRAEVVSRLIARASGERAA
jgi:predicted TPR repeat methyltransferase